MSSANSAPVTAFDEGWASIVRHDLLEGGHHNSLPDVVRQFLRKPVETILRLTDDKSYRAHWGFLSAALGAQLTLGFAILPGLFGPLYQVPGLEGKSAVLTNEIVQYAGIAVLTPIQYYVCRALGKIARTPMSYVKLCVLSVGYCAIISTLVTLAFWAIGVASTALSAPADPGQLGVWLTALAQIAVVVFVTMVHRRFWGMSWPVATGVTIAIAVVSWGVVYPMLDAVTRHFDIAGRLGALLP